MYWRFFPLTLIDFTPEVMVGVFPQPAELARFARTSGAAKRLVCRSNAAARLGQYLGANCTDRGKDKLTTRIRPWSTQHRSRAEEQSPNHRRKVKHVCLTCPTMCYRQVKSLSCVMVKKKAISMAFILCFTSSPSIHDVLPPCIHFPNPPPFMAH